MRVGFSSMRCGDLAKNKIAAGILSQKKSLLHIRYSLLTFHLHIYPFSHLHICTLLRYACLPDRQASAGRHLHIIKLSH
jgi:hypothetical protein